MNVWLHRISHHAEVSYPLLERDELTIGFSDFSNQEFIDDVLNGTEWQDRWNALETKFDDTWGGRPRTRHNLWRFIESMKKGDWVIVPSWGTFSVFEIDAEKPQPIANASINNLTDWHKSSIFVKDNLLARKNKQEEEVIDLGFFWKVKPIAKGIARYEYADAPLTSRMKIRTTNAWITDLKESVVKALKAHEIKKPVNLHSQILEAVVPNILQSLKTELTPDKFEYVVKWYFQRVGATEVIIPSKNESGKEGDADVIAIFEPIKTVIYTQVKFHEGETNSWAIEQIKNYKNNKEAMDDGYSRIGWVITTANKYSDDCFALAKEEKVQLIEGEKFAAMLLEAGITNLNRAI